MSPFNYRSRALRLWPSCICPFLLVLLSTLLLVPTAYSIRVHLVAHSHTDAGWLKTVDQYFSGTNRSNSGGNVHQILDSVLLALTQNSARRFSYGEQAFFQRWVRTLNSQQMQQLRAVVASGQLEFINGGWVQHDEGDTHYSDMVDQTALGHRFIRDQFGEAANPRAGWQIDSFGHSATHVALLTGEAGLDGLILARMDQQETAQRRDARTLEFLWQPSPSLPHDVFTYILAPINQPPGFGTGGYYGIPWTFCFNMYASTSCLPPLRAPLTTASSPSLHCLSSCHSHTALSASPSLSCCTSP